MQLLRHNPEKKTKSNKGKLGWHDYNVTAFPQAERP